MFSFRRTALAVLFLAIIVTLFPESVLAYGGPGSVISGIGALLAAIAALFASLIGFVWFPLKRLIRKLRGNEPDSVSTTADEPTE